MKSDPIPPCQGRLRRSGPSPTLLLAGLLGLVLASGPLGSPDCARLLGSAHAEEPLRATELGDSTAFDLLRRMAREDTLDLPEIDYVYGSWIDIEDQRPTLEDILRWCIENEKSRLDGITDASFRRRLRVLQLFEPEKEDGKYELTEVVEQVYARPPNQVVTVELGSRTWKSEDAESEIEVEAEVNSSNSQMADLPFFFRELSDFEFSITERRFLGDRILYRIDFVPRSEFASLPSGWFLVDTGDYQVLRAEFSLTKNVPFPLLLKSVDQIVIQRQKVDGVWWAQSANVQVSLRKLPLLSVPRQVQMEMQIEDLRINPGLPDSIWAGLEGR